MQIVKNTTLLYEPKVLNQVVKRNVERFLDDFRILVEWF